MTKEMCILQSYRTRCVKQREYANYGTPVYDSVYNLKPFVPSVPTLCKLTFLPQPLLAEFP